VFAYVVGSENLKDLQVKDLKDLKAGKSPVLRQNRRVKYVSSDRRQPTQRTAIAFLERPGTGVSIGPTADDFFFRDKGRCVDANPGTSIFF